ncbi:MAG: SOS response-associated peptidase, partial [Bacteroidales bacterium]|nr:SOS response-associated peptidase [Bacteroidales bacterium]
KPRYNCAPTQNLAVISNKTPTELSFYRWGLIPFWAKDKSLGNKLINARAESITEKASFKHPFKRKRCLVLSDGFFEWKKISSNEKIPYRITMRDKSLFAMAGIWDSWKEKTGELINSFSIITIAPNNLMEQIHSRMPVIIEKDDEQKWLLENDPEFLKSLLKPFNSNLMTAYPVSKLVNSPVNDNSEILKAVNY